MEKEADSVSITFEFQKNSKTFETIQKFNTSSELCPVKIWAAIVIRLGSHKGAQYSTYVNIVYMKGEKKVVISALLMKSLKSTVKAIGE